MAREAKKKYALPSTGCGSGKTHSTQPSLPATTSFRTVANKHIITRIHVLLDQLKLDNSIFSSWTPAHTNADNPLAKGNVEADRLMTRGCAVYRLETMSMSSSSRQMYPNIALCSPVLLVALMARSQ